MSDGSLHEHDSQSRGQPCPPREALCPCCWVLLILLCWYQTGSKSEVPIHFTIKKARIWGSWLECLSFKKTSDFKKRRDAMGTSYLWRSPFNCSLTYYQGRNCSSILLLFLISWLRWWEQTKSRHSACCEHRRAIYGQLASWEGLLGPSESGLGANQFHEPERQSWHFQCVLWLFFVCLGFFWVQIKCRVCLLTRLPIL